MARKRKEIIFGKVEEIEHWSKTSCVEPQPVGRHKKINTTGCERSLLFNGDYRFRNKLRDNNVFSISTRPNWIASTRHTSEGKICDPKTDHGGEAIKNWNDDGRSPKFTKKTLSPLRDVTNTECCHVKSCLNPNPNLEQKGISEDGKKELMVVQKSENTALSEASTSGHRLEDRDRWIRARKRLQSILSAFREYCDVLLEESAKVRGFKRVDFEAANWIKRKYLLPTKAVLGPIPGIEVGDRFSCRMELHLLGLHRPPVWGIDFMLDNKGRKIAISIVDSGEYDNCMRSPETLIYCGHGGNPRFMNANQADFAEDQKLKMGNSALMNSIETKNPVRVIRGTKVLNSRSFFYVGLYTVETMWKEKNSKGNLIFKFKLVRLPGQPSPFSRKTTKV